MSATYQLNTTQSSINIHINSEDAANFVGTGIDSGLIQTSDFVIVMEDIINCDEEQNMLISIQNLEIPLSYYNVSLAIGNNKFLFQEGNTTAQIITLPSQNYNVDDITTDLSLLLNNASTIGATYSITYNSRTLKFNITSSTGNFTFNFSSNAQTGKLLGFFPTTYTSSNQSLQSITPCNVNSIPFMFLETNFNSRGSVITSTQLRTFSTGVIMKIPIDRDFGDILSYSPVNKHTLVIERKRLNNLRFTLRDSNYNVIDLNGISFSFTLTIDFIDFEASGVYDTDPRSSDVLKPTRDDVSEVLTNSLLQQGAIAQSNADNRNRLINVLQLNNPI